MWGVEIPDSHSGGTVQNRGSNNGTPTRTLPKFVAATSRDIAICDVAA